MLPPSPLLAAFLLASLLLAITPGPAVVFIVARSVSLGRRAGLASAAGVAVGSFCNMLAAATGLAALLAWWPPAYGVVKYAGAAWLLWLGIRALRASGPVDARQDEAQPSRIFLDAMTVALLNPSTLVFFAVFLPQFLAAGHMQGTLLPLLSLGGIFVLIAIITDSLYALLAGSIQPWLHGRGGGGQLGKRMEGAVLMALAVLAALR